MRRLRVPGAIACLLAVTVATACGSAAGQSADVPSPDSTTFSTPSGSDASSGAPISDATRTAWLAKGGCRAVPTGPTSFAPTPNPPGSSDPEAAAVLTVTGRFAPDQPAPVALDLAQLDAMPQVECTVDDSEAEGGSATFRGVLVADLLAGIGAQPQTTLHTAALNDYAVDLPVSDIHDLPVLLATRMDGQPMSVANYGPLRVIYPTTGYQLDPTVYDPRKIWQLSTVDVA